MAKELFNIETFDTSFSGIVSYYQDDTAEALKDLGLMFDKAIELDLKIKEIDEKRSRLRTRKSNMICGIKHISQHLNIKIPFSMHVGNKVVKIDNELDIEIIPLINA